jgi:hypothetical protein
MSERAFNDRSDLNSLLNFPQVPDDLFKLTTTDENNNVGTVLRAATSPW